MPQPSGRLILIGAGPGDPELLTLKAARLLRECDVVLYDRLVSRAILAHAREDAEYIYVGKREGEQEPVQARIFSLILEHALAGKVVGRLKGGDPLVFGRGAEEWALAREHGIPVEFVPGLTSAIAVPGLAGIPLSYRGVSQSFAVITGQSGDAGPEQWKRYADVDTLVVLMGVKTRQAIANTLIEAGRCREEPAAFVSHGSLGSEQVVETSLGAIAESRVNVESPAILVVGEVVRLRGKLFPTE